MRVIDPQALALGLAWDINGRPILAIVVDHTLAIRVPEEALDQLAETLAKAREELSHMAPMVVADA